MGMDILGIGKLRTGNCSVQRPGRCMDGELLGSYGAAGDYAVCSEMSDSEAMKKLNNGIFNTPAL